MIASVPVREYWLFRLLPLRVVVPAAVAGIAAGLIAVMLRAPLLAAIAAGVAVFALGTFRIHGNPAVGLLGSRAAYHVGRLRHARPALAPEPFDVPAPDDPDGRPYGMRWDGNCVVTMLRVDAARGLTFLGPGTLAGDDALPLAEIARCLTQFDIGLASIDVVSTGARTLDDSPLAQLYQDFLGPLPATAYRSTWLVLRLDPLANTEAIAGRGGGPAGIVRAARIATRRIANLLPARGTAVTVLTAAEMDAATRLMAHYVDPGAVTERWTSLAHSGFHLTSFEVAPERLDSALLHTVWTTACLATTMVLRISPDDRRGAETSSVALNVVVRFATRAPLPAPPHPGLRALPGAQLHMLRETLPTGPRRRGAAAPAIGYYPARSLAQLMVPAAATGQLIGADDTGRGVAAALVGPGLRLTEIIGTVQVAQQVILRAIAVGARVVVHTNRPEAWRSMIERVAAPQQLSLSARPSGAGLRVGDSHLDRSANVVLFDGVPGSPGASGVTTVCLLARSQTPEHANADVTLRQSLTDPNAVVVRVGSAETTVRMVATPEELAYLD
jgi:type VII secretion protein EccE